MKTVVVANHKGGVGKTLTATLLAQYASLRRGLRVLLLDLDPQVNLTRRFLGTEILHDGTQIPPVHPDSEPGSDERIDAADLFRRGEWLPYPTRYPGIEIIPSHGEKVQALELVRAEEQFSEIISILRQFIVHTDVDSAYDLCIIDTRPSMGPLSQAAYFAATHMLIPAEMEAPSVEGLQKALYARKDANERRPLDAPRLELAGILANKFRHGTIIHEEFLASLREDPMYSAAILKETLPDWMPYRKAMLYDAESIFQTESKEAERAKERAVAVCEEVLQRIGLGAQPEEQTG